jgi:hypothetical protein
MTSQINTNGINTNYPVPGTNNSSQGFRDNFTQITTQLNTAASEISDIQSKAILKAALNNTALNNDMANALISNASISGFRSTTYNLGNALAGTVLVNVNQADVQFGAVQGNILLQFSGWSPTNTESNVVVRFTMTNPNAVISFPNNCIASNNNFGVTLLENYADMWGTATVTAPANAGILEYQFTSLDCGNTVTVTPVNRPFQSTQIITRDPPPTGVLGDVNGDVAVGSSLSQLTITSSNATGNYFTTANTSQLYPQLPVLFTGNIFEAGISVGNTYYVRNVVSDTDFTVASSFAISANVELTGGTGNMYANPASYLYVAVDNYNSTAITKTTTNTFATNNFMVLSTVTNLSVNAPIVFTGNVFGGLIANQVYYITTIDSGNSQIAVSYVRQDGIAGANVQLATANGVATATCYTGGNDIWRRINLTAW